MHTKILPKTPLQTVVLSNLPLAALKKMPNAATAIRYPPHLASSWLCNRCSHSNGSSRNKKCCFSCQAWRNGLAPLRLSVKGGGTSAKGGGTWEELRPTSGLSTTTQPATTRMAHQTTRPLTGTGVQGRGGKRENLPLED